MALGLGLACSTLAALLYRSYAEQARLSSLLAKREGDLAKMVSGVSEWCEWVGGRAGGRPGAWVGGRCLPACLPAVGLP